MAQVNFSDKENGDYLTANDVNELKSGININESLIKQNNVSGYFDSNDAFRYNMHIVPKYDDRYDIGDPDHKVRDLYVSEGSIWMGDDCKIDVHNGKVQVKSRDKSKLPSYITGLDGSSVEGATGFAGVDDISEISLHQLEQYAKSLDSTAEISKIFPKESDSSYSKDDYINVRQLNNNSSAYIESFTGEVDQIVTLPIESSSNFFVNCEDSISNAFTFNIPKIPTQPSVFEFNTLLNNTTGINSIIDLSYQISGETAIGSFYEKATDELIFTVSTGVKINTLFMLDDPAIPSGRFYTSYEYINSNSYV